ncbi:VWA domain-containing protein [Flammeovirgaceae bacterium SG7u.111]|nr:VWA domain-containing protein [Flammeovirgaceae bacterium SG7u.132]WPO35606.1 VWA domain-containing protein [Flammeovirgaceae bacterium SG7u.111]
MTNLFLEYSGWYVLLCFLVGAGYAYLLYQKKTTWGKPLNYLLAFVRFTLIALICLLLLGPYVKQITNEYEKPTVVFAIDNSQSIPLVTDSNAVKQLLGEFDEVANSLKQKEYNVEIVPLEELENLSVENASDIKFDSKKTNLSDLLRKIQVQYENRNLAEVVLFTDGVYNQGISPDYIPYNIKISTIGIGDTLPQIDINLKTIYSNNIAYLGNKFPLVAEIANNGFAGKQALVLLKNGATELERKTIDFTSSNGIQNVEFLVDAEKEGMQHYIIQVLPLEGEFTTRNNLRNIYIDVLDSKEKILLVAAAPHPDIKAIRSVVEKNKNYEFNVYIPTLLPSSNEAFELEDKYDLVIFHQVPNIRGVASDLLEKFRAKGVSTWFILGNQSDIPSFNRVSGAVNIIPSGRQVDKVTPNFNNVFDRFTFDEQKKTKLAKSPPISVPFGNFDVLGNSEVILFQKVGNVPTNKPMLVVNEQDGVKSAVLLGEGIWQWKLHEFASFEQSDAFDDMVGKLIQFLSTKEDKRRFKVYPTSNEYSDAETVYFETEVYNAIYEKIYGQKIDLQLVDSEGETSSYTFMNNNSNFRYAVNGLPSGVYKYKASTVLDGNVEVSTGDFTIKKLELEALNTTANFNLLRNLSKQTGGEFYYTSQLDDLHGRLLENKAPDIIHSREEFSEILNLEWILALFLLLATFEWVMRKVKGSY